MATRLANITFDCGDALRVAKFWSGVLGRPLDPGGSEGFASIGGGDAERGEPAWFFEKVPEDKRAKNRVHLDLVDPDATAADRFVALGATVIGRHSVPGTQHHWTVLQDPEGNEFCVAAQSFTV